MVVQPGKNSESRIRPAPLKSNSSSISVCIILNSANTIGKFCSQSSSLVAAAYCLGRKNGGPAMTRTFGASYYGVSQPPPFSASLPAHLFVEFFFSCGP
jgi:hypothetical protein